MSVNQFDFQNSNSLKKISKNVTYLNKITNTIDLPNFISKVPESEKRSSTTHKNSFVYKFYLLLLIKKF